MSAITAAVGRQPIVDRRLDLVGYELLFRPLATSQSAVDPLAPGDRDGDRMTNDVIFGTLGIGVQRLVGDRSIFVNADRGVLTGRVPVSLPPRQTVIEVLETVTVDDEVLDGCRALKRAGYKLAADDFTWFARAEELLELVDIVKIDVQAVLPARVPALMALCQPFAVKLLAEKIETEEELRACLTLGFDLFQGYHVGMPKTVSGPALSPTRVGMMRMASAVLDDDVDYRELERILRTEPALSYQLIQLASIGRFGELKREMLTLRQALVWIGLNRLRGWIPALLLRPAGKAADTNLPTVLGRARAAEILAGHLFPQLADAAFTAGMFSALDLLLGVPNGKLPGMLEIPPHLHEAIFNRETPVGKMLGFLIDYELHGATPPVDSGIGPDLMASASVRGFDWAIAQTAVIDEAAGSSALALALMA